MKTVQTVCGPASASELGHFQMHEHLFVSEGPGTHRFPALLADDCDRSAREAARYAVEAPQNRRLLRRLRYTYIPEEFYFQNAFEGTPWAEKITGDALRFSIWDEPERGTPALLEERDLPAIDASGCVFCRKVNAGTALYETLERRWLCDA